MYAADHKKMLERNKRSLAALKAICKRMGKPGLTRSLKSTVATQSKPENISLGGQFYAEGIREFSCDELAALIAKCFGLKAEYEIRKAFGDNARSRVYRAMRGGN